jgi:hypothetical protein
VRRSYGSQTIERGQRFIVQSQSNGSHMGS